MLFANPTDSPGLRVARRIWAGVVILAPLFQIFLVLFIVPKFVLIFQDMLQGKPLPALTAFVLVQGWVLIAVALVTSLAAMVLAWRRVPASWLVVPFLLTAAQVGVLVIALFMPMNVMIQDMGVAGP